MGQLNTSPELHQDSKAAAARFDDDEISILIKTWQELAERSLGKGIDKETFLQYFPLSGLLGERLFAQFDTNNTGLIDLDHFVKGLAISSRGSHEDKIKFIFEMYNPSHGARVSKEEISTLINHVPKGVVGVSSPLPHSSSNENLNNVNNLNIQCLEGRSTSPSVVSNNSDYFIDDVDQYTNHSVIEKAFEECDVNHQHSLNFEEFKMWIEKNPQILQYFESILPFVGSKEEHKHKGQKDALPNRRSLSHGKFRDSATNLLALETNTDSPSVIKLPAEPRMSRVISSGLDTPGFGGDAAVDDEEVKHLIVQAMDLSHNDNVRAALYKILQTEYADFALSLEAEVDRSVVVMEDWLFKRGGVLHLWNKRWVILSGNCLYYYANQHDVRPRGVIFLIGSLVEKLHDEASEAKGYFGIEILHQAAHDEAAAHHKHEQRILYARSEQQRDQWIAQIHRVANVVPFERDYVISDKLLGRGKFSSVFECVNKVTGEVCAVKVMDKNSISADERKLLKSELQVLKMCIHPNIIRTYGQYESRSKLYITMERVTGGDLYSRIVGHSRFSEEQAARILCPLLESILYLHDLGITHRDIKPENILCGEQIEDIKLADFGLSKMHLAHEKMQQACGTLSYVAPEVLDGRPYGQETDLWSVGVIMCLLLCGRLPFDGETQQEIISATIKGDFQVPPHIWDALSSEARTLMKGLLCVRPPERLTARGALRHPFLLRVVPTSRKTSQSVS